MDLDRLAGASGEWLRGTGPDSDIVISSRIRLARNVEGFPFLVRADRAQRQAIEERLREAVLAALADEGAMYLALESTPELDLNFLVERHLISRELAQGEGPRGVAFSQSESIAVMINEEDHVRAQVIHSGLNLEECWRTIDFLENEVGAHTEGGE